MRAYESLLPNFPRYPGARAAADAGAARGPIAHRETFWQETLTDAGCTAAENDFPSRLAPQLISPFVVVSARPLPLAPWIVAVVNLGLVAGWASTSSLAGSAWLPTLTRNG
jgi:hypothetical protein